MKVTRIAMRTRASPMSSTHGTSSWEPKTSRYHVCQERFSPARARADLLRETGRDHLSRGPRQTTSLLYEKSWRYPQPLESQTSARVLHPTSTRSSGPRLTPTPSRIRSTVVGRQNLDIDPDRQPHDCRRTPGTLKISPTSSPSRPRSTRPRASGQFR